MTSLVVTWLFRNQVQNSQVIKNAEDWIAKTEMEYPLLAYQLELGKNWKEFADRFLSAESLN